jgi:hypothetical protein
VIWIYTLVAEDHDLTYKSIDLGLYPFSSVVVYSFFFLAPRFRIALEFPSPQEIVEESSCLFENYL